MSVAFPEVRVGEPLRYEALSVFPLFAGVDSPVEYLLSDEGIGSGCVTVEEVSEQGSVPDLLVENKGDLRVLFLEGEELVGAKQNRVLNTSVLIAAKSKVKIPVSCVEAGRWAYRGTRYSGSRQFGSGGTHSPSKLRSVLKMSVSESMRLSGSHRSDQSKVWAEVSRQQESLGTSSASSAMSDTFQNYKQRVTEFQGKLQYVDGASGVAVAIGHKIVAVDMFDKPATCRKVWNRLLSGYVLDALEAKADEVQVDAGSVQEMLGTARAMSWEKAAPVGEGEEYRAQSGGGVHASALTFHESPVHLSVVTAG
jgi:hypothetical protein